MFIGFLWFLILITPQILFDYKLKALIFAFAQKFIELASIKYVLSIAIRIDLYLKEQVRFIKFLFRTETEYLFQSWPKFSFSSFNQVCESWDIVGG